MPLSAEVRRKRRAEDAAQAGRGTYQPRVSKQMKESVLLLRESVAELQTKIEEAQTTARRAQELLECALQDNAHLRTLANTWQRRATEA